MSAPSQLKMNLGFRSFTLKINLSRYLSIVILLVLLMQLGGYFERIMPFPKYIPIIILLFICGYFVIYYSYGTFNYFITDKDFIIVWCAFRVKQVFRYQINIENILEVKKANKSVLTLFSMQFVPFLGFWLKSLVSIRIKNLPPFLISPDNPDQFIQELTSKILDKNKTEGRG